MHSLSYALAPFFFLFFSVSTEFSVTVLFIIIITSNPNGGPTVTSKAQKGCLCPRSLVIQI